MARLLLLIAVALCVVVTTAKTADERQRLRVALHKNNQDLAKLNKEAEKLMSFVEKSQKRSVPVAKNAKAVTFLGNFHC